MSEYSLANDLAVWSKSVLGMTSKVVKSGNNTYEIYLNNILRCRFDAANIDGLQLGLTRFKMDVTSILGI